MEIHPIAHIHTDLPTKFGLPRQSGLVDELQGEIVFEREYRQPEALRGLEEFTHIWLIWEFSHAHMSHWSATVRPPRLGGNTRMGVFATRSPFRPNSLGLSVVSLKRIDFSTPDGPKIVVGGIDMVDGTPIYDIKPYVTVADCIPDAAQGFTKQTRQHALNVKFAEDLICKVPADKRMALIGLLSQDPRPGYENDPNRHYGVEFAGLDVRFYVQDGMLYVCEII